MTPKPSVPDLLLEQLHLGELDARGAAEVRAALGEQARQELARLTTADAADLAQYPPELIVPRLTARIPSRRRVWPVLLPTLAAAAAGVWWMARPATIVDPLAVTPIETVRAKGPNTPVLHILKEGGVEPLAPDTQVNAGTRIQLRFAPKGARHALIVSVDGRGVPTLHWPDAPSASTAVPPGVQRITVGHAYELDDAPKFERFHLITADEPLQPAAVLQALESDVWTPPPAAREAVVNLRKP